MRADRLIAELMLLQTKGKVSANELAREMEVSPRTIYRDMLSLNMAGIPVYAENGSKGGYRLVDGYRTQLTGFNAEELQALFAMNIPAILGDLGMDQNAKAAMRKLQASLSSQQNEESRFLSQRFLYDPSSWDTEHTDLSQQSVLETSQKAVWEDKNTEITLQYWYRPGSFTIEVLPYALVIKNNVWYLVFQRNGSFRVERLSNIIGVEQLVTAFRREAFDLSGFWEDWCKQQQAQTNHYAVDLLVKENAREAFINFHSRNINKIETNQNGWCGVQCVFNHLEDARSKLLSWGGAIQVLAPEALKLSMVDFARQFISANQSTET